MTLWAVSMMKDEEDVAGNVLLHLAEEGCAGIIVADNGSTDGTRDRLEAAATELRAGGVSVVVQDDPEVGYYQSRKMTALAAQAATAGATWVLPFDADEVWYSLGDRLSVELDRLGEAVSVARFRILNHFESAWDDPLDPNPFTRMVGVHPEPNPLPKVAFRCDRGSFTIHQGNHGATLHGIASPVVAEGPFELRHFPYRGFAHFERKARNGANAYAATDLPADSGSHWRAYGETLERAGAEGLRSHYEAWFRFADPQVSDLARLPAPWRRWSRGI